MIVKVLVRSGTRSEGIKAGARVLQIILVAEEMTQRQLSDEELEKIVEDVRGELTAKLAFLNHIAIGSHCPQFWLEFYVISPLYYRLQRHLIDWGTRSDHPHLADLKLTQYLDKEGKRYYDKLLTLPGDRS